MGLVSVIIRFILAGIFVFFLSKFLLPKMKGVNEVKQALTLFVLNAIILLLVLFFPWGLGSKTENEIFVDYPAFTGPVVDEVDLLTANQRQEVLNNIRELKDYQLAVAILKDTRGLPVQEYTLKLAKTWGIGEAGKNNGILFSIVPSQREVRITTGYGTGEKLTDMKVGMILDKYVVPYFIQENIPQGIISGTQAIVTHLNGETLPANDNPFKDLELSEEINPFYTFIFSIFLAAIFSGMCVLGVVVIRTKFPDIIACLVGLSFVFIGAGLIFGLLLEIKKFGGILILIGVGFFILTFICLILFGKGGGGGSDSDDDIGGGGGSDSGGGGDFDGGGAGRSW